MHNPLYKCGWFTQKGSFMHWKAAMSVLDFRVGGITCMGLTVVMQWMDSI